MKRARYAFIRGTRLHSRLAAARSYQGYTAKIRTFNIEWKDSNVEQSRPANVKHKQRSTAQSAADRCKNVQK